MSPGHTRSGSIQKVPPPAQSTSSDAEATKAYMEQVRLLVLGMEQRLQAREEKLMKTVENAEAQGAKYDELKRQTVSAK